jgi:UDP-N-acetylmuramate dehydrogenase
VGGAVVMNAGTADGSIGDLISSISVVQRGKISESLRDKLDFSYRKLKLPKGTVITGAKFELLPAPKAEIESRIGKIRQKRKDTQPLLWPSLGSVFKNPKHAHKAWQLIDECNLRGVRVGGARVSNEHANWIINEGSATANDVEVLIRLIKEKVKEKADILLETEIVIMGE